ncbi:DUF692 domain-containing protein [Marinomonas sp. A79]|uniref:DUF692 domain-containing protein n=1 Tax=Marinomonas vulgaris TaxID=2823372 RepID=A0ABS5HCL0_9GAMM|nr:DUF692 domain-containing protein [Marinomonas vulgaris]MBR7889391.1 DUF692 domain-containing protein [Marinomonas vulgaris]
MNLPFSVQKSQDATASSGFLSASGVSLKPAYYHDILNALPALGFFEIHAENYLSQGGPAKHYLHKIREHYDMTVHGVGLSIGGALPLDKSHLARVVQLVNDLQPAVFSEHLAWSTHDQGFFNDLLPVAYDKISLQRVCDHIDQLQNALQRPVLIENPSTYFEFTHSDFSEIDFITAMVKRSGCGLLLDINNVEVSCFNRQANPYDYLDAFPTHDVGQIHLAGHTLDQNPNVPLKIDSHDQAVCDQVWALYEHALTRMGDRPTLIERDGNLPSFEQLFAEAQQADQVRSRIKRGQPHA